MSLEKNWFPWICPDGERISIPSNTRSVNEYILNKCNFNYGCNVDELTGAEVTLLDAYRKCDKYSEEQASYVKNIVLSVLKVKATVRRKCYEVTWTNIL